MQALHPSAIRPNSPSQTPRWHNHGRATVVRSACMRTTCVVVACRAVAAGSGWASPATLPWGWVYWVPRTHHLGAGDSRHQHDRHVAWQSPAASTLSTVPPQSSGALQPLSHRAPSGWWPAVWAAAMGRRHGRATPAVLRGLVLGPQQRTDAAARRQPARRQKRVAARAWQHAPDTPPPA